jgi:prevent-host-death family protein
MITAMTISRTDLARRTRQVVNQAHRGQPVIVESYGEEQVAILDALDYRCLRALVAYTTQAPHAAPINNPAMAPRGLDAEGIRNMLHQTPGDVQATWNQVLAAYLDGDVTLGRAAELLGITRFELQERFNRLGLPLRIGPADLAEAQQEVNALR